MNRLARLREKLVEQGLDAVIITKPTNIRYLSGFTGSSGSLLLTGNENILLTDFRYLQQAAAQAQEFRVVRQAADFYETVARLSAEGNLGRIGLEKDTVTLAVFEQYLQKAAAVEYIPIADPCAELRAVKAAEETETIKKAVEIADRAFLYIRKFLAAAEQTENETALELESFMRRMGAERKAFDTIVASGWRAALPHGVASGKIIGAGELVTLDFGAVYNGYHSDLTRTLIMGEPSKKQREIYDTVLEAQFAAIAGIGPGMKASEADALARKIIEQAGYGDNFGHGLGHAVGLDIHEGPRLSPQDETLLLPGMVLTVEPGIYLEGWGGVRIEDMILVTDNGCEVLTKAPKGLKEAIIIGGTI